jgi:cytochrome P450
MEAEKKGETIEYSDKDLIDEFTTFMIAGTETTSRLFTMMVYYISRNPSV